MSLGIIHGKVMKAAGRALCSLKAQPEPGLLEQIRPECLASERGNAGGKEPHDVERQAGAAGMASREEAMDVDMVQSNEPPHSRKSSQKWRWRMLSLTLLPGKSCSPAGGVAW